MYYDALYELVEDGGGGFLNLCVLSDKSDKRSDVDGLFLFLVLVGMQEFGPAVQGINALFDLENGIYTDVLVQKEYEKNELKALCEMVDRSPISGPVLLLAGRNYEAYNNLAHLEKRGWKYVIRPRDKSRASVAGVQLPNQPEFDLSIRLSLLRLPAQAGGRFMRASYAESDPLPSGAINCSTALFQAEHPPPVCYPLFVSLRGLPHLYLQFLTGCLA